MTGEEEIEDACGKIRREIQNLGDEVGVANVVPLYATLPPAMQQKIFDKARRKPGKLPGRKIVVSTNIAETSSHDRRHCVRDRSWIFQAKGVQPENPRRISTGVAYFSSVRAAARRRAGRTQPGKCFRLYTEQSFKKDLQEQTYPEILRSNLGSVVLQLKKRA